MTTCELTTEKLIRFWWRGQSRRSSQVKMCWGQFLPLCHMADVITHVKY